MHTLKKHTRNLLLGLSCLLGASASLAGGSLDLSLSNDTVRLGYDATKRGTGLHLAASALYNEDRGSAFGLGVHVVDLSSPNSPVYIGVGARVIGLTHDDFTGLGLGVGGFLRYRLPVAPKISLAPYIYYAPSVVTFMDAKGENILDADFRIQYSIIPTARAYVGVRYVGLTRDHGEIDDGVHLGIKIDF